VKTPKYIRYLCVDTERELHQWVTGIRIAKNGKQLFENYRGIEEEITHAEIDILTSKRFSGVTKIPPNTLQILSVNQNGISDTNGCKSPARTPMSENKSFDSAVSSGNPSECSSTSLAAKKFKPVEVVPESEVTPVNTLERHRSSAASSSSGCMSDRCSISSAVQEHGFESDFPTGGTIKKRPSANPRLPLTNTTWGLVTSNELEDGNTSGNVRVGDGGTLLRRSLRRKSSRESIDEEVNIISTRQQHRVMAQVHRDPVTIPTSMTVPMGNPCESVDLLSEEFETSLNVVPECDSDLDDNEAPLPPPPRAESIDLGALQSQSEMTQSTISSFELDELPPPPPPLEINIYQPQQQVLDSPPALPPPVIFNSRGQRQTKMAKKISFDDNVQLIGISSPEYEDEVDYEPWCPKNIVTEMPKKLTSPPVDFLKDLQRVMNKKWQVAEHCKGNDQTPHQALGFREVDMKSLVGTGKYM